MVEEKREEGRLERRRMQGEEREEGGLPREGACGTEAAGVGSLKDIHAEDTEQGQQGRRGQPGGSVRPAAHRDTSGRRRR